MLGLVQLLFLIWGCLARVSSVLGGEWAAYMFEDRSAIWLEDDSQPERALPQEWPFYLVVPNGD